jgi:hypothetical protein
MDHVTFCHTLVLYWQRPYDEIRIKGMYMHTFLSILLSLMLGWGCSHLARQRGRSPLHWLIAGALFGIFALIALFLLPVRKRNATSVPVPVQIIPKLAVLSPSHQEKFWYFLDAQSTQFGPMSFDALSRAWNEGKVGENTYVWNESMDNWQRFQEVIKPLQT